MKEYNPFTKPEIAEKWRQSLHFEHSQENPMDRKKIIYTYIQNWMKENNIVGRILDFGSGEGFLSTQMPSGISYVGIEPSEPLVKMAKESYIDGNSEFRVGNAYNTELEDENADGVVSVMVWFHLKDLEISAKEVFRNLKSGGRFLIITANPKARKIWENFFEDLKVDGKVLTGKVHTPGVVMEESITYIHTNEETVDSFEQFGLIVEKVEAIGSPEIEEVKLFVAISGIKK